MKLDSDGRAVEYRDELPDLLGNHSATILLEHEGDADTALAILKSVGIRAAIGADAQPAKSLL